MRTDEAANADLAVGTQATDPVLQALHRLVHRLEALPVTIPIRLAYSLEETAFLLSLDSVDTVRSLIDRGLLKPSRGLRHLRVAHAEIERYLNDTSA